MNHLAYWVLQQKNRFNSSTTLAEALVSSKIMPYAFIRLRFVGLNNIIMLLIHIIEFLFLYSIFEINTFILLLIFRALAMMTKSGWWGALEVMRSRVRIYYNMYNIRAVSREISYWLFFTFILAIALVAYASWNFYHAIIISREPSAILLDTYIFTILITIAIDIIVLTFHNGVYAIQRVPRPFYSISITYVLSILLLFTLYPLIHIFVLPLSILFAAIISGLLSIFYSAKVYRLKNIFPLNLPESLEFLVFLWKHLRLEFILTFIAGCAMAMDKLVVAFLLIHHSSGVKSKFLITLYLIAPLIAAASGWVVMFYFDLKRHWDPLLLKFKQSFEKQVLLVAFVVAIIIWVVISVFVIVVDNHYRVADNLLILTFIVLISSVTYLQLLVFCNNGYINVIVSAMVIIASMLFIHYQVYTTRIQIMILIGCYCIMFLWLLIAPLMKTQSIKPSQTALCQLEWQNKLTQIKNNVFVIKLLLIDMYFKEEKRLLVSEIVKYINEDGAVYAENTGNNIFIFFTDNGAIDIDKFLSSWLIIHGRGIIGSCQILAKNITVVERYALIQELFLKSVPENNISAVKLYSKFITNGVVIYPGQVNHDLDQLEHIILKEVLNKACNFIRDRNSFIYGAYSVEALLENGIISTVFLTSLKHNSYSKILSWQQQLKFINMQITIH